MPEGTPVKAAEDGVVAYAGNELKGYGNLVLVRHSNGYVTAYAHASELLVKRGDTIKRGQIIAKSGQTGNVASPQLHFEIRKGSSPVDPTAVPERAPEARHPRLRPGRSRRIDARRARAQRSAQRIRQPHAEPSRQILHELPGDAAGARAARGRPFQRLALAARPPRA